MFGASLSDLLNLPVAPNVFGGMQWESGEPLLLPFLDLPFAQTGPPPDPDSLYCPEGAELYPYQEEGVRFLLEHPIALLGDEMGLGKSIQAIAALRLLINRGELSRALILCPKTLLWDWYYKLRQWAPDLRAMPMEGPKKRRTWYWRCNANLFLAGYETWREDSRAGSADPAGFDLVILDEVQRIKNGKSATHQAVCQLQTPWRWALSGTPLENRVAELVAIFAYLQPGLLPEGGRPPVREVRAAIAPYLLRRRKREVLAHLPPKESRTVWLELTPVQRMAYQAVQRAGLGALSAAGQQEAPMLALALLTRLKLVCNLDPPTGSSCKMDFLERELAALQKEGDKALIFSQYPEKSLKPLLPRLAPYDPALFDGSLSDFSRQILVARFQQTDQPRVLAMSLKCGGVGITLTRACHVYHLDHWWNPAAAAQAEDRTHRIGQQRTVRVTTLLTRGTIEERIADLVEQKRELFRKVMDPLTEGDAAEPRGLTGMLSREELLGLFN